MPCGLVNPIIAQGYKSNYSTVCIGKMLASVSKHISNVSVIRRLLFAVVHLPKELPQLWGVALEFATHGKESKESITPDQCRVLIENLKVLECEAFNTDADLLHELISHRIKEDRPMGVILISGEKTCIKCGSSLHLRKDRPSPITIYDDQMGTVPGSHYHKCCLNSECGLRQYYGY